MNIKSLQNEKFHLNNNAKMVPFAGYNMPVQYEGVNIEHHTVRNKVGVFDVSHMGEIFIKGNDSLDFLQYVLSNDITTCNQSDILKTDIIMNIVDGRIIFSKQSY